MEKINLNYAIQCRDANTNKVGVFFFDLVKWKQTGQFHATSKIYPNLEEFYRHEPKEKRKKILLEREI